MTVEIATPSGLRAYCGVLEFSAPDGVADEAGDMRSVVVAPRHVMENVFCGEATRVSLRAVELPKLSGARLLPADPDAWARFVREAERPSTFEIEGDRRPRKDGPRLGVSARAFLEEALSHYACLSRGDDIVLSARGREFAFTVLRSTPENVPAGTMWTGFFADLAVDIFDGRTGTERTGTERTGTERTGAERTGTEACAGVCDRDGAFGTDRDPGCSAPRVPRGAGGGEPRARDPREVAPAPGALRGIGGRPAGPNPAAARTAENRAFAAARAARDGPKAAGELPPPPVPWAHDDAGLAANGGTASSDVVAATLEGTDLRAPTVVLDVTLATGRRLRVTGNRAAPLRLLALVCGRRAGLGELGFSLRAFGRRVASWPGDAESVGDVPVEAALGLPPRDGGGSGIERLEVQQRLTPPRRCDACVAAGAAAAPVTRALRSFAVGDPPELLGLCEAHRCRWLEELASGGSLVADPDLTRDFVLGHLVGTLF
jgi:hypothetical protein